MFSDTINWFRCLFDAPSAESIALRELEECKRELLNAHSSREYAESMCGYYHTKITRLNAFLHNATKDVK
jgi:hypothetical protein